MTLKSRLIGFICLCFIVFFLCYSNLISNSVYLLKLSCIKYVNEYKKPSQNMIPFIEKQSQKSNLIHQESLSISKAVQELKQMKIQKTETYKVHSQNKTCTTYFNSSVTESLNSLLRMKTDDATEHHLHKLGLPHLDPIDDLVLPQYVQRNIYDKIPTIVCGASSNHFAELQALFYHIDTKIRRYFPDIKVIFYDIGLSELEKERIVDYGRVEYRKFNFDLYPPHIKILHLCAWKPIIIQNVVREVGFAMYMDTSLRTQAEQLHKYFNMSEKTGHFFQRNFQELVVNTLAGTFTYFKVKPCIFHGFHEIEGGYMMIRSDSVISLFIMRAWLTCALQKRCIMPHGAEQRSACKGPKAYHRCHREDQSALGITLFMIYHQPNNIPLFIRAETKIRRDERSNYLMTMTNKST